jgi:6-phosphofructokinase 1
MNSSLVGILHEAAEHNEIEGVYGALFGIQGLLDEALIDLGREDPATIQGLSHTPAAALGSCRYKLRTKDCERALEVLKAHNVRYFFYIGGNDSAETAHRIAQLAQDQGYELYVLSLPKTIDNDLMETDHCLGYGSVARFVAMATMDASRDTEAMRLLEPIKIIEVMGRDAGWIAAAAALAKRSEEDAPHLICTPERPLIPDRFLEEVQRVYRQFGYVVAVMSEMVRKEDGTLLAVPDEGPEKDPFGHPRPSSPARFLCQLIRSELGLRPRFDKPGTIQRTAMAYVSSTDLEEAHLAGRMAVRYALQGKSDCMVTLVREPGDSYRCSTGLAPLAKVANAVKTLPDEYINPEGNFVTEAFLKYARPLIGDPLPIYPRLQKVPVERGLS